MRVNRHYYDDDQRDDTDHDTVVRSVNETEVLVCGRVGRSRNDNKILLTDLPM